MTIKIICIKYKVKDCLKGWSYTGVYKLGETSADNNDTDEEIKKKTSAIIIKKNIVFTNTLYLVLTISSPRSIGVIPYEKNMIKNPNATYKIDVASHLGLAHYAVAGTVFTLESLDIALYDKDDYITLS